MDNGIAHLDIPLSPFPDGSAEHAVWSLLMVIPKVTPLSGGGVDVDDPAVAEHFTRLLVEVYPPHEMERVIIRYRHSACAALRADAAQAVELMRDLVNTY